MASFVHGKDLDIISAAERIMFGHDFNMQNMFPVCQVIRNQLKTGFCPPRFCKKGINDFMLPVINPYFRPAPVAIINFIVFHGKSISIQGKLQFSTRGIGVPLP